jgi:hypothetical protein
LQFGDQKPVMRGWPEILGREGVLAKQPKVTPDQRGARVRNVREVHG